MNKKKLNKIGIFLFLSFILIGIIISFTKMIKLEKSHLFTIGVLNKIGFASIKVSTPVYYSYYFKNKRYDMTGTDATNTKLEVGKRYYVKLEKNNPENSVLMVEHLVSDSIKEAPPGGWEKLPE